MKRLLSLALRGLRRFTRLAGKAVVYFRLHCTLFINNVNYKSIHSHGLPYFCVSLSGKCTIGKNLNLNNGLRFNPIGFPQPCIFYVGDNASLSIGDNVGMSQSAIICHKCIEIHDNVKIGGGVKIYDTDFHSIDSKDRRVKETDMSNKKTAKVTIEHDVFIGAGSFILKGVTIGAGSVIGAGSIVTKDVPTNQVWAGNPAKFIKQL